MGEMNYSAQNLNAISFVLYPSASKPNMNLNLPISGDVGLKITQPCTRTETNQGHKIRSVVSYETQGVQIVFN